MSNSCECHNLIKTENVIKEDVDSVKQEDESDNDATSGDSLQDRPPDAVKRIKLEPEDEDVKSYIKQTCIRCHKSLDTTTTNDSNTQNDTQRTVDDVDVDFPGESTETVETNTHLIKLSCTIITKCKFVGNSDSLQLHQTVHNTKKGEKHCCSKCNYKTYRTNHFNNHVRVHTKDTSVSVKCPHCSVHLKNRNGLSIHLKRLHSDLILNCKLCNFSTFFAEKIEKHDQQKHHENETLFSCERCSFVVDSASAMEIHQTVHDKERGGSHICKICEYETHDVRDFNDHILSQHGNYYPYTCPHCQHPFIKQHVMNKHIKRIHPNLLINCEDCDFTTTLPDFIDEHRKREHSQFVESDKICCQDCTFTGNTSTMELHRIVHQTSKGDPYCCTECDFNTSQRSHFNNHISIHTGYRPHRCRYCSKCFRLYAHLCEHVKNIHPEILIHCPDCDFHAITSLIMEKHIKDFHQRNHLNLIYCQKCDFMATSSHSIDMHQIVHQPKVGKYYICKVCDFEAAFRVHFNQHIFVHTGDRPYKCSHCTKCYTTANTLHRHVKSAHPGLRTHINKAHQAGSKVNCEYCDYTTDSTDQLEAHHQQVHIPKSS